MTKNSTLADANTSVSSDQSDSVTQIAIIGAGLTGLISAQLLQRAFESNNQALKIVIFEKSAGVGRLATRYKKPDENSPQQWQFDFGAQFFTAKSAQFKAFLQPWVQQGIIEPWLAKTATFTDNREEAETHSKPNSQSQLQSNITASGQWDSEQPRYISSPKMTHFGRSLAATLKHTELRYKTRVAPLSDNCADKLADSYHQTDAKQGEINKVSKTTLFDENGNDLGSFDWVVCTAPQAQAIELLQQTDFKHLEAIQRPKMLACYTLMLGWDKLSDLPQRIQQADWDVLQVNIEDSAIGRVFIEHHKPGRELILPSLTIHASNNWSEAKVDEEITAVQQQLLQATQSLLGWEASTAPTLIDCHRWRYAATEPTSVSGEGRHSELSQSSPIRYVDHSKQWIVTGDWCDEGRIESCYKAASKVVETIID